MSQFRFSESATRRLEEILASEPGFLRVEVLAGGCNGFQYRFDLTQERAEDDEIVEAGRARVLLDPASADMLAGAELEYVEGLMGSYFTVKNPQAKTSCGCGTSFSVD